MQWAMPLPLATKRARCRCVVGATVSWRMCASPRNWGSTSSPCTCCKTSGRRRRPSATGRSSASWGERGRVPRDERWHGRTLTRVPRRSRGADQGRARTGHGPSQLVVAGKQRGRRSRRVGDAHARYRGPAGGSGGWNRTSTRPARTPLSGHPCGSGRWGCRPPHPAGRLPALPLSRHSRVAALDPEAGAAVEVIAYFGLAGPGRTRRLHRARWPHPDHGYAPV